MTVRNQGTSDEELVQAARGGDAAAFGALVRRYESASVRVATVTLGRAEGADDVTQEAFVKAYRALDRFRAGSSFKPWLFRIVANTARNRQRSQVRYRSARLRLADQAPTVQPGPDDVAVAGADRRELVDALNRLRPDDRLILTYRWYLELTEAEIATALGCRRGTVKSRLSRALGRLRAEMVGADGGAGR